MAMWEGRSYSIALSTLGDDTIAPESFKFQFEPVPPEGVETFFYRIVPEGRARKNPFEGCGFVEQGGRKLTRHIPMKERLNPKDKKYTTKLQELVAAITGDKIAEDPFGYERLVGFVPHADQPLNPISFYQVAHTHADDSVVILVVQAKIVGANPDGTIVVVGR
jgi:hypothetical protein